MGITSRYLIVNSTKIYCETNNGPSEKGTIICLGSAGRDTRQFHGLMECLKNDFEVMAFDMPGHGKSWPLRGNKVISDFHEYGNFIIDTAQKLKVINPIFIGCALGGNMVFYLAQRQPVRAIVSMAGSDYSPYVNQSVASMLNHPYCNVQFSHMDFTESLVGSATSLKDREFILWGVCSEVGIVKFADYAGVYNGFDVREGMKAIKCPVLILRGEEDWSATDAKLKSIMNRMPNVTKITLKTLPGLGHYNPQESPGMVSDAIIEFLSER